MPFSASIALPSVRAWGAGCVVAPPQCCAVEQCQERCVGQQGGGAFSTSLVCVFPFSRFHAYHYQRSNGGYDSAGNPEPYIAFGLCEPAVYSCAQPCITRIKRNPPGSATARLDSSWRRRERCGFCRTG